MLTPLFEFKSLQDLLDRFPDETSCIVYLERIRWGGVPVSPYDTTSKVYAFKSRKHQYKCKNTGRFFNVKTGTFLENTKIPIKSWFLAIYLLISDKKGRSSHQLARDLKVTQKTAWFILHRLRYVLSHPNFKRVLEKQVVMDETYVGGKQKYRHRDKRDLYKSSYMKEHGKENIRDKKTVIGAMDSTGQVIIKYIQNSNSEFIVPFIYEAVKKGSMIVTDEHKPYKAVEKDYPHETVKHMSGQYMNEQGFTTNPIEGFWAHLKRSIYGIYHTTSRKHMQSYLDEISFRYNTRSLEGGSRFIYYLRAMDRRITYKELTSNGKQAQ